MPVMQSLYELEERIKLDPHDFQTWLAYLTFCKRANLEPSHYPSVSNTEDTNSWKNFYRLCYSLGLNPRSLIRSQLAGYEFLPYEDNLCLSLSSETMTNLKWMAGLELKGLFQLHITKCPNLESLEGLSELIAPNLVDIQIRKVRVPSLDSLSGWTHKNLKSLTINESKLEFLTGLKEANLPSLFTLDLEDNFIKSLIDLEGWNGSNNLAFISFDGNPIKSLKGLKGVVLPSLLTLHFCACGISSLDGILELEAPKLENIWIRDTPCIISEQMKIKMRSKFPNLVEVISPSWDDHYYDD